MADVFISYCRAGTLDLVRRIAQRLDDLGISYWHDTKSVNVGGIANFITREIQDCKVFLLLLDESANASPYVFAEVHASFPLYRKQITPIPVQIGRFELDDGLKFYLSAFNILYGGDSAEAVNAEELACEIARVLDMEPPQNPSAKMIVDSAPCGENVTFTLDEVGRLTISGAGPMRDHDGLHNRALWNWAYYEKISSVRIENGVTSIGDYAFDGCRNLTSVSVPDSVVSIGDSAFSGCKSLTSVNVPDSVVSIGDSAFSGCKSLTSVNVPDSVDSIGDSAFDHCENLTAIRIPNSVTSIGDGFFSHCKKLVKITIPERVTFLEDYAFWGCQSLTSVHIPDSVTYIGNFAFFGCDHLENVSIPGKAKLGILGAFEEYTKVTRRPPP